MIVVNELPLTEHNAMLHLFSTKEQLLGYGAEHYRQRSSETSTLLYELINRYREVIEVMPNPLEEFASQTIEKILRKVPKQKLVELLSPEERLEGLSPEKRLEGLSPEKRLEGLSPEKRLEGLSAEQREALLRLLTGKQT